MAVVDHDETAVMFKALGDPTRLRIFQFLRCCPAPVALDEEGQAQPADGPTVGEVCCSVFGLERPTSTISFHVKELRNAGLIHVERRGKHMILSVRRDALARLADFFDPGASCCSEDNKP